MRNLLVMLLVFTLSSCQEEPSSLNSILSGLSGDEVSQSFFSMNERLISTIGKYESRIEFTDTLIRDHNIRLNSNAIFKNYYKTLDFALVELDNKEINNLYTSNHRYLLDTLFGPHLSELHNQHDEIKEIYRILNLEVQGDSNKYQRGNQLVKNQIFYNHVFQFLFRYKLEEEVTTSYIFPIINNDSLLGNGKRELGIYIASSLEADDYVFGLEVNNVMYDSKEIREKSEIDGEFKIQYDPSIISDSFYIKTYTTDSFSGKKISVSKMYGAIKG